VQRSKMMVLNDNATFTNLEGCRIVSVPADWTNEQIENAVRERMDDDDETPWRMVVLHEFTKEEEEHSLTD
jgi:hypothetical protein